MYGGARNPPCPPSPVENARARVGVVSNPCPTGSVQPQMPCYDWAASLLDRQVRKVLDMDSSTNALGATYNAGVHALMRVGAYFIYKICAHQINLSLT